MLEPRAFWAAVIGTALIILLTAAASIAGLRAGMSYAPECAVVTREPGEVLMFDDEATLDVSQVRDLRWSR